MARRIVESLSLPLSAREHRLLRHDVPASGEVQAGPARRSDERGRRYLDAARDLTSNRSAAIPTTHRHGRALAACIGPIANTARDPRESGALAEESFRHALALNPELSVAHHFSAQLDLDLGWPREALLRLLGRAREHQADPQLFAGLVQACRYCGLLSESLAAHRRARALDPSVPTSATYTHWAFGDYPAALDTIVADNDPFRAMVLSILDRPEEALASLDESARRAVGYPIHEAYVELVRATVLNQPAAFQSRIVPALGVDISGS